MLRTIALACLLATCVVAGCSDPDTQSTEGGSTTPLPWTGPAGNGTYPSSTASSSNTTSSTMTTTYPA